MAARVVDHPLVHHHLARLRSVQTDHSEFRQLVQKLTVLLGCDSTKDLATTETTVVTPLCETPARKLDQSIALVPILRAGLGMVDPLLNLIPQAEVWHLGLYRNEETMEPVEYYNNLPANRATQTALILDPMLATGGSAALACSTLKSWGVPHIKLLSLIAAPEGIETLNSQFPDLEISVCSIDQGLNDSKFIVPGLGDAGDRYFNTEVS